MAAIRGRNFGSGVVGGPWWGASAFAAWPHDGLAEWHVGKRRPYGVAEYRLQSQLPAELKGKLPTAKQLTDVVREILPARGF